MPSGGCPAREFGHDLSSWTLGYRLESREHIHALCRDLFAWRS
jgi:hypothetical protein